MNFTSPMANQMIWGNNTNQTIQTNYTNLVDWSWMSNIITPQNKSSFILGAEVSINQSESLSMLTNQNNIDYLAFGYKTAGMSEYSASFLNSSQSSDSLKLTFSSIERGLILPKRMYQEFAFILNRMTNGSSMCPDEQEGATCLVNQDCSFNARTNAGNFKLYELEFLIQSGGSEGMTIPLASFA